MKILPAFAMGFTLAGWALAAEVQKDIPYAKPGGISLTLDECIPDGPGPFPAVIIVHGGGWGGGDKASVSEVRPLLGPLTSGGIAWFSINYRLSRQALYPACVEDVETAVRYVKAHAKEYDIDPDKIALSGDSAGGHIVDMVAVRATPDKPERRLAAVVSFYGPDDLVEDSFRRGAVSPSLRALFGIPVRPLDLPMVKLLQEASPTAFVSPDLPPFLLVHGTADPVVDFPGSVIWKEDLDALGVPCELIAIPGGIHVMANWDKMNPPQTEYKKQMVAWLRDVFAQAGAAAKPRAEPSGVPVTRERVEGFWKKTTGPELSGIDLAADGAGDSISAPASSLRWSFNPETAQVHIDYPAGQGRDVPYAGSPDLTKAQKEKIAKAGARPKVGFADWRYFPAQDIMIASNGEIFRRHPRP